MNADPVEAAPLRVAVLSESPADEAALRVLIASLLAPRPVRWMHPMLQARGWPHVLQILPAVLRHLHFGTETDAFAVVVDADDSVLHRPEHDEPGNFHDRCRLCRLRATIRRTLRNYPPVHGRDGVKTAVGVAAPAIEAWYLAGQPPHCNEAWLLAQPEPPGAPLRLELKRRFYATERPSLAWESERAVAAFRARRDDWRLLEEEFPGGFTPLADAIRRWTRA